MKKLKIFSGRLFRNQSGQGATEYILLLVVVVGLIIAFKKPITEALQDKISTLRDAMSGITP